VKHTRRSTINGRAIWITRPAQQAENLRRMLESAGANAINFPVIEITPVLQQRATRDIDHDVAASDLIIFTSRNAVIHAESALPDIFKIISAKTILAVGEGTRRELAGKGIKHAVRAAGSGSEVLLKLKQLRRDAIAGKRILIVRGVGGRKLLEQALSNAGAKIKYLEVYQRVRPETADRYPTKLWRDTPPDAIIVTSVEGLMNLIELTGETNRQQLLQTPLAVMSDRIRAAAKSAGFIPDPAVASNASDGGLLRAVSRIFED
jgi:uroporphyrinogen-III synthase